MNLFENTVDAWGGDAFKPTTTGMLIVIAVLVIVCLAAVWIRRKDASETSSKITTRQLVFSAIAMAIATVLSMVKLFEAPMGGSVTLCSMLFIVLIGYWYGPKVGVLTGVAYGLLQFVMHPLFYAPIQMLLDYPLAFGALGLSGIFFKSKKFALVKGYVIAVICRYAFAVISGAVFFGSYAPEGMPVIKYSLLYNGSYLGLEALITLIIIVLPPIKNGLTEIRKLALAK